MFASLNEFHSDSILSFLLFLSIVLVQLPFFLSIPRPGVIDTSGTLGSPRWTNRHENEWTGKHLYCLFERELSMEARRVGCLLLAFSAREFYTGIFITDIFPPFSIFRYISLFLSLSRERQGGISNFRSNSILQVAVRYRFFCKFFLNTQLSLPSNSVFFLMSLSLSRFFIRTLTRTTNSLLNLQFLRHNLFLYTWIFFRGKRRYWINISFSLYLSFYSKNDEYILYFLVSYLQQ